MLKDQSDIALRRLTNERLIGAPFASPKDVIKSLVAVQSQDYGGAKWGVSQRVKGDPTDAELDKLFDDGVFLRTHIMRPTWHFVSPDDIMWLQMLTGPRVLALSAHYLRKLNIDDKTIAIGKEVLAKELAGQTYMTRPEIAEKFAAAGIESSGLKFAYIIMCAELDALICSGARKGKTHTYGLVSERAPHARKLGRDEALAELTLRYFTGHGPAQPKDFSWWSGLTMKDVTAGLDLVKSKLQRAEVDGKTYWFADVPPVKLRPPVMHLLPNYDEFLIAYKDHTASFDNALSPAQLGNYTFVLAHHIIVIDGKVVGGWRRVPKGKTAIIEIRLLRPLSPAEEAAIDVQAKRCGIFAGVDIAVVYK